MTWARVAEVTGRRVHPTVQWHKLIGSADALNPQSELWSGGNPHIGELATDLLTTVCAVGAGHTGTPDAAWFCLWEGGIVGQGFRTSASDSGEPPPAPGRSIITVAQMAGPRVRHPYRNYLIFGGPLAAADGLGHWVTAEWFLPQSPNLLWPDDRAWCLASEIDFDSTLVGGSAAFIADVLATEELEAWPVGQGDSLTADSDSLNR